MKASEIARLVGGTLAGAGDPEITGVTSLERSTPSDLSLLASARYLRYLPPARAGAILVAEELADSVPPERPRIVVPRVHAALARILDTLYPEPPRPTGIHPTAVIGAGAEIGPDAALDAYAIVGAGARLGARVSVGAHAVIGAGCEIGDDVVLHPHVTLYRGVRVGPRTVVHSGCRLGVDGFGYTADSGGMRKVPQIGTCEIGADVEIGANSTIDRGSIGPTSIADGVKIDNLVHIAHNVTVGESAIIVAQVGVAGSVEIGRGATLAGQAGISGHLEIGEGATIAAQAGVIGDVPAGETYSGYPARPHREAMRASAALFRLPSLVRRIRMLERAVFGARSGGE